MSTEIKVPTLPESIADALVVTWHKKPGEAVTRDEVLVDIETDKVVLEVPAAEDGVLGPILETEGATVVAHQVIGSIEAGTATAKADDTPAVAAPAEAAEPSMAEESQTSPTVRRMLDERGLDASQVTGTGENGRITPEDVEKHAANPAPTATSAAAAASLDAVEGSGEIGTEGRTEKRVPMSRLRARIAERLLDATQTTAMLTTFNEVNLHSFIQMRNRIKEDFQGTHGIKLGFMSIFLKAATEALKRFPEINASIDGDDIVYHGYCDIGVAVSSDRGLVVPVLRNTEYMSLADIEKGIAEYAEKARDGKLSIEEMTGGTFTVSNGGVFGSMLSTPILNPPQSAILGMHATQDRPVAENGEIVIRPMMYLALSYDHRIVDGKGAVTFLKTIKELVENPERILFDV